MYYLYRMGVGDERKETVIVLLFIRYQVLAPGGGQGAGKQVIGVMALQVLAQVADVEGNILWVFKNGRVYLLQNIKGALVLADRPGTIDEATPEWANGILMRVKTVINEYIVEHVLRKNQTYSLKTEKQHANGCVDLKWLFQVPGYKVRVLRKRRTG